MFVKFPYSTNPRNLTHSYINTLTTVQLPRETVLTFLEGLVDANLALGEVLVALHVGKHAALVAPVVVMGTEEEDRKVADVVLQRLNVGRHQTGVADLSGPPPAEGEPGGNSSGSG